MRLTERHRDMIDRTYLRRVAGLALILTLAAGCSPSDQFWHKPDLGTRFTSLDDAGRQPQAVRFLDLFDQQRAGFPPAILALTNLERLSLRKNAVGDLPDTIASLTRLAWIDLGACGLTNLPATVGSLPKLTTLYLNDNALSSLPDSLGDLRTLCYLNLDRNQLAALPASIGKLESLRWLRLNGNRLSALPADMSGLARSLKRLYLRENPLPESELNRIRKALPNCEIIY